MFQIAWPLVMGAEHDIDPMCQPRLQPVTFHGGLGATPQVCVYVGGKDCTCSSSVLLAHKSIHCYEPQRFLPAQSVPRKKATGMI